MRNIIILVVLLLCACNQQRSPHCATKYTVNIWNINASMAYTIFYHINDDSVLIEFLNGVENGHDSILLKRSLIETERAALCNYLSSFDIDTLNTDYLNPLVEDGDQKKVTLQVGSKKRTVNISNFYQKDMGGLFEVVNNVINDNRYKIKYRK